MEIKETSLKNIEELKNKQTSFIIGLSIWNSYFNPENLKKLIFWADSFAKSIYIMIPDEPMISTMMACGYNHKKAIEKSRTKANGLQNKCSSIIDEFDIKNIRIIRWKDIKDNPYYLDALNQITFLYDFDQNFKCLVQNTTKGVIFGHTKKEVSIEQINIGVNFLFQELAFILYSTVILNELKTLYVYKSTMELIKEIINGNYTFTAKPDVNFITVE